jgi:hypothetical protein
MLKRLLFALSFAAIAIAGTTGSAFAAFDPTPDELSIGTFILMIGLLVLLTLIYGVIEVLNLNNPEEVEIPDHAHDHRYAGHH